MLVPLAVSCRLETDPPATESAPPAALPATETAASPTREVSAMPTPAASPALPVAAATLAATPVVQIDVKPPSVIVSTPTVEVTRPPLGEAGRPVQLLFPPVANSAVIMQRAEPLAEAIRQAAGVEVAVGIVDDESAAVALLCSAAEDAIAFISAAAYTVAHDECDAEAALVAAHADGLTWKMGMLVTRAGAAAELADLDGQSWAVADPDSLPNYLYFRAQMAAAGIEPGEIVDAPEESTALLALRDGETDFTTASFVPPIMPSGRSWIYGETEPEEWRLLGIPPSRSPIGYVIVAGEPEFGGYRLRDARARLFDTAPDIFTTTRILSVSEPIPNETVVLGADFPPALAQEILTIMTEFAASPSCTTSLCSADMFGWTGLEPADDRDYNPIRAIRDELELEAADLWAGLD